MMVSRGQHHSSHKVSTQDITIIQNKRRRRNANIAEGLRKAQQIRSAIRRGRDLCAEPPKYNRVQKRKEITNRKGTFVVAQPKKSWRASIHFKQTNVSTERSSFRSNKRRSGMSQKFLTPTPTLDQSKSRSQVVRRLVLKHSLASVPSLRSLP
jgi:hypothetical protein